MPFCVYSILFSSFSSHSLSQGKNLNNLAPDAKAADAGLASNSKLMIMLTKQDEKKLVEEAKGERMRGFEDDDRLRSGRGLKTSGVGASAAAAAARRSEPTYRFHAIAALPMLPEGAKPEKKAAEALLKQLSTDKAILSIMQQHKWSVGRLSEMPPEGKVGVSDSCLMGLNKNAGQEILLRLRTDDWQGLRPYTNSTPVWAPTQPCLRVSRCEHATSSFWWRYWTAAPRGQRLREPSRTYSQLTLSSGQDGVRRPPSLRTLPG